MVRNGIDAGTVGMVIMYLYLHIIYLSWSICGDVSRDNRGRTGEGGAYIYTVDIIFWVRAACGVCLPESSPCRVLSFLLICKLLGAINSIVLQRYLPTYKKSQTKYR